LITKMLTTGNILTTAKMSLTAQILRPMYIKIG
jgi:hypothetical protein